MTQSIFINLPVKDLSRATGYYLGLGYEKNPQFSDDSTSSIVINEHLVFLLHTREKLQGFLARPVADGSGGVWGTVALSMESREAVDQLADKAISLGAEQNRDAQDYGFMYSRGVYDLDSNLLELVWMDPSGFPAE
jgi:predicted lactoylglutathione lyase